MQDLANYTPEYYLRETWFEDNGLLRTDQLAALCYALGRPFWHFTEEAPRHPGVIYSIGCGKGMLEKKLEDMGYTVTGVDPSPGAKELYQGSRLEEKYDGGGGTIIFCESIEHIPRKEIDHIFSLIPSKARIIITNWPDYYPMFIDESGWDHITRVDDELYDTLSENAQVILRKGSHLVLEKL